MANIAKTAVDKLAALLKAPEGLNANVAALAEAEQLTLPQIPERLLIAQNVAVEVTERATELKYPAMNLYCETLVNELREKFRTFSGRAGMAMEVRLSQDRLEGLEDVLRLYVDAATQVLERNHGDWGGGLFYGGGYQVAFRPVARGGKHLVQTAKITFELGVSK